MTKSRYDAILNFPKKLLKLLKLFKLFGVIYESLFPLVTHMITFALFRKLYCHKTQFFCGVAELSD